jgi:hypothetical protein
MKDIGFEDGRKDFDGQKRYFAWIGLQWKPTSVKAVKVVKALSNLSLGSKEKVVNCPDNPDKQEIDSLLSSEPIEVLEVLGE